MGKAEEEQGAKLRAAIYTRISLDRDDDREGVERQQRDCELICRLNNFEIVKRYEDNSVSAFATASRSGKEREDYDQMLKDFKNHEFDVIVAWKLDRLVRSVSAFEDLARELSGLCICTSDLGGLLDLRNPAGVMQAQIMVSMAQFESARKSERVKDKYRDDADKGFMRSNPHRSFGYTHDNKIIPDEAAAVKAAFEAYAKGCTMGAIARALNGEDADNECPNVPAIQTTKVRDAIAKGEEPPAIKWSLSRVSTMLRNPKYAGFVYHAPTEDGKHQSYHSNWRNWIKRDEDGNYLRAKNVEPIVDEALWTTVQTKRDRNLYDSNGNTINRRYGRKSIGTGVYLCADCGNPLKTGGRAKNKKRDYGMTYHCATCHRTRLAKPVDDFVLTIVKAFLASPEADEIMSLVRKDEPRIKEINDEISVLNARITQANYDYDEDIIPAERWKSKVSKLEAKIAALDKERAALLPNTIIADVLSSENRVEAFEKYANPQQIGELIDTLFTVKVKPHDKGKRITPECILDEVSVRWKEGLEEQKAPSEKSESAIED